MDVTYILSRIRKNIEESRRTIPYSKEKVRRKATIQFWKVRIQEVKGKLVDKYAMEKRERYIK